MLMQSKCSNRILSQLRNVTTSLRTLAIYQQGQSDPNKTKIREYFYYIDHNGMVNYN